jgi:hypothetical protein
MSLVSNIRSAPGPSVAGRIISKPKFIKSTIFKDLRNATEGL